MDNTDIPDQIAALIGRVKEIPNNYARNKVVSRLEDAKVWAKELRPQQTEQQPTGVCTCPEGGIRADCPVHGLDL